MTRFAIPDGYTQGRAVSGVSGHRGPRTDTALIDRVVHHADVISIEGDSYRVREAELDAKTRAGKPKGAPIKA